MDKSQVDHEMWFELLEIESSKKGELTEKLIDSIIDKHIDNVLLSDEQLEKSLTKVVYSLEARKKQSLRRKKLTVILFVSIVALILSGFAYKYFENRKGIQLVASQTETAEIIEIHETSIALTFSNNQTSTAQALITLTPTPTITPTPLPTETLTPQPTMFPANTPLAIEFVGSCNIDECYWVLTETLEAGLYNLYIKNGRNEANPIKDEVGEISINLPTMSSDSFTFNLSQCTQLDESGSCFVGMIEVNQPIDTPLKGSLVLNAENLQTLYALNLEFIKVADEALVAGDVLDRLIALPHQSNFSPCISGECVVVGSYKSPRTLFEGSKIKITPETAFTVCDLFYVVQDSSNSDHKSETKLLKDTDGWLLNFQTEKGGIFILIAPQPITDSIDLIIVINNPTEGNKPKGNDE